MEKWLNPLAWAIMAFLSSIVLGKVLYRYWQSRRPKRQPTITDPPYCCMSPVERLAAYFGTKRPENFEAIVNPVEAADDILCLLDNSEDRFAPELRADVERYRMHSGFPPRLTPGRRDYEMIAQAIGRIVKERKARKLSFDSLPNH